MNKTINIFLLELAIKISNILNKNFIGFYIYGSYAKNSWDPVKSDIDFIVITKIPINRNDSEEICNMHAQLNPKINRKLEGEYIDLQSLQKQELNKQCIVIENGQCLIDSSCQLSSDNLFDLIHYGKLIYGQNITELNIQINDKDLVSSMNMALIEDKQKLIYANNFEALYKILINVLRAIYTIKNKKTPTKQMAIEFNKNLIGIYIYNNIQAYNENKIKSFEIRKQFIDSLIEYGLNNK